MDFYIQLRQRMVDTMQLSLKQIRQVLSLGVQEFSDIVGMTRQSINNLENCKSKMSTVQYIAICAVIDNITDNQPELMQVIISILNSNDTFFNNKLFDDSDNQGLLKRWFLCFPDDSKFFDSNMTLIDMLVENFKIFLDDTALCEMTEINQVADLLSKMKKESKRFIIPLKAIDSIQSRLISDDATILGAAHKGVNNINQLQQMGLADIRGEESDYNIANTVISVFSKFKASYRLALITQNEKLANEVFRLNEEISDGFDIGVFFLADGMIKKWCFDSDNDSTFIREDCEQNDIPSSLIGWDEI